MTNAFPNNRSKTQHIAKLVRFVLSRIGRGVSKEPLSAQREWLDGVVDDAVLSLESQNLQLACNGIGCNGCCRGAIPMTDLEWGEMLPLISKDAFARAFAMKDELLDPDRERLAQCPLIDPDTGGCSVYEERPMTCRAYHSVAPSPDWCWPELVGPKDVPAHPITEAAVVALLFDDVDTKTSRVQTLGRRLAFEAQILLTPVEWEELSTDEIASVALAGGAGIHK